ncbi:MAG: hypothetical protein WBJ50_02500, partial [Smithellaceae bacterium]
AVHEIGSSVRSFCNQKPPPSVSPAKSVGIDAVNSKIRTKNLTEMAVHTFYGLYDFRGMIALFVE